MEADGVCSGSSGKNVLAYKSNGSSDPGLCGAISFVQKELGSREIPNFDNAARQMTSRWERSTTRSSLIIRAWVDCRHKLAAGHGDDLFSRQPCRF